MKNFRLTSLALLLLGVILNSCNKNSNSDDPNNSTGQGGGPDDQYKIVITTDKAVGEEFEIYYSFANIHKPDYDSDYTKNIEARQKPWIDFNNNGIKEKNEFLEHGEGRISGVIASQTINVYGKVVMLIIEEGEKVTKLDISQNNYLEHLGIINNPLEILDVTKNINLEYLEVSGKDPNTGKGLTSLLISGDKNKKINNLSIHGEGIETLEISNFPELALPIFSGKIKNLKISNNPKIDKLQLNNCNEIVSIDVSNSPNLGSLFVGVNAKTKTDLKKINLLNTPGLTHFGLDVVAEGLTSYDLTFCVQVDANRINNIPYSWKKSFYNDPFNRRLTINYQTTPCP